MNVLFMSPHGPATVLKQLLTDNTVYMQLPPDEVQKAAAGNHFFGLPRKEDIHFAAENILLLPKFYENREPFCDFDLSAMILALKKGLNVPALSPDKSFESLKVIARARHLFERIRQAHPSVVHLVNYLQSNLFEEQPRVTLSNCVAKAEALWETANMFYVGKLCELIGSYEPDLVFCQAIMPQALPFAVSMALKIKTLRPHAKVLLINSEWSLTSTVGHYRDDLFTDEFFDIFDGAIVYADLQPLTICDVIQNVSSGKNLDEVENVVSRKKGAVFFNEPKPETTTRFFEKSSLHKFYDKVSPFAFENDQAEGMIKWASPVKSALIFPSQQACYWNRCRFCSINTQNFLLRDPHVGSRGNEVADLLVQLKSEGYHTAFLGREAVPPEILSHIVNRLQGESDVLPWGFEGRFGTYLSTEFIGKLKNSGCCGAVFGLETPSDRLNKLMDKYDGNVNISFIERVIEDCQQAGMLVNVNTILNLPGTTQPEYAHHIKWLKTQFNKNRFFHFTANYFGLYGYSDIGKHPEKYGIELLDSGQWAEGVPNGMGMEQLMDYGWKHLPGNPKPDLALNAWQEIFQAATRWGINLGTLHILYHECFNISAVDMLLQTNCFKRLQADLSLLVAGDQLHFRIPEHVLVKEVTRREKQGFIFIDTYMGTNEFVSHNVLKTISVGMDESLSIGEALDQVYGSKPKKHNSLANEVLGLLWLEKMKQDKARDLKTIIHLAASDLLVWD